jgi:hypothetical protein
LTYYRSVFTYAQESPSAAEVLQYVIHPEGFVWNQNGTFVYKYFKRDHLGSTRVLLAAENGVLTEDIYKIISSSFLKMTNKERLKILNELSM